MGTDDRTTNQLTPRDAGCNAGCNAGRNAGCDAPSQPHALPVDLEDVSNLLARVDKLNQLGIALSSEHDTKKLLENILLGAKDLTNADAGTMYTKTEENSLKFQIIRTDSLKIAMGGTTGVDIPFPPLPLYKSDGEPNLQMIAAAAALQDITINIPDAYEAEGFDFTGTKKFDQMTGYRSKSFLTVPLKNHEREIIGVLQLINAKDFQTGEIRPFSIRDQQLAESLASQAAISMTNQRLIEDLKKLFESFIKTIANAIDDKSPYTGGHCERVPVLSEMLARAAARSDIGELKDYHPSEDDLYELRIAAWMHDCGKVVTPEYVVDKATKLQTIYDRIHSVNARFDVLKRDAEVAFLRQKIAAMEQGDVTRIPELEAAYHQQLAQIQDDQKFVQTTNIGGEFMTADRKKRIQEIGEKKWVNCDGELVNFLTEDEIKNLCIAKGTLTDEEREIINHHVVATKNMLKNLNFPKQLKRVPEMAGSHHETMNGKGYPEGLTRDQMSIGARIMAIADVFEALTASDRPYKPAKTLSESLKILGFMKKDQHVDPDLFQVFIKEQVYLEYAQQYLDPKQIDEIVPKKIPGYEP
ncbi:MAG: HD domain-containing protein [Magnetococcales bacterium]|nr:HD domain-containing protein [Magnetococcales bacterium]